MQERSHQGVTEVTPKIINTPEGLNLSADDLSKLAEYVQLLFEIDQANMAKEKKYETKSELTI
ncbi:hypothetical protein KBC75_01125 [Candidatus Shapirobacteria bacterium]|nr:hypothetical protein [Candidatus Shapirobacteria bacterium]